MEIVEMCVEFIRWDLGDSQKKDIIVGGEVCTLLHCTAAPICIYSRVGVAQRRSLESSSPRSVGGLVTYLSNS